MKDTTPQPDFIGFLIILKGRNLKNHLFFRPGIAISDVSRGRTDSDFELFDTGEKIEIFLLLLDGLDNWTCTAAIQQKALACQYHDQQHS